MWDLNSVSPNAPLTDAMIADAQNQLELQLPDAYLDALRIKNGGSTIGSYIRLPDQEVPAHLMRYVDHGYIGVGGVNGIGESHESILVTSYMSEEWGLPAGLVLLDGDGHTWIAFDYRGSRSEPPIVFVESDSGDTFKIAENFLAFFSSLVPHEVLFDYDGNFIGPSE